MTTVSTTLKLPDAVQFNSVHRLLRMPALQCAVLVVLLVSASIIEATQLQSLGNATSWLHLQAGNWIIAHHAVPYSGILSQSSDLPWADPNWGLQVALAALSRVIGIRAIPVVVMVFRLLFALATFILAGGIAGGRRGNFWLAVLISLWAQMAVSSSSPPAASCSAILFSLEVYLLLRSRASGRPKLLYWIPFLILIWVNLDWRFVLGVIAFCLFCGASAIETSLQNRNGHLGPRGEPALLGWVAGLTCLASLVSPNSYHSYVTAWQSLFGASLLRNSLATASLTFREPQHYLLMALVMCAFLFLGRRHARDLFQVLLLAGSLSLGFALGSEVWITAVTSVAVMGEFVSRADAQAEPSLQISVTAFRLAVAMAAVVLLIAATRIPPSPESLLKVMANRLPVRACDFVRKNHLPEPIYNEMEWGGFLAWYLPEYPVAIDDRYELYGETRTGSYYEVTRGQAKSSSDPTLAAANTILLSTRDSIVWSPDMFPNREEIFRLSFPGSHEVYRDDLAVVLTKQQ
jgi:hypothetical protein